MLLKKDQYKDRNYHKR